MKRNYKQHIFFVDDEPTVREVVGEILEEHDAKVSHFAKATDCLSRLRSHRCDLLIIDLKMPEMDGIGLLRRVRLLTPWVPVLIITGHGDIPTAVEAVKAGAVDIIEKPIDKENSAKKIKSILQENSAPTDTYLGKPLTLSQTRVLKLVVDGKSNKEIARLLKRSRRTVEVHRARAMRKLGSNNLFDLVKRVSAMGLIELQEAKN